MVIINKENKRRTGEPQGKRVNVCFRKGSMTKMMVFVHLSNKLNNFTSAINVYSQCSIHDMVKIGARIYKRKKLMDQKSDINTVIFGLPLLGENDHLQHCLYMEQIYKKRTMQFRFNIGIAGVDGDLVGENYLHKLLSAILPTFPLDLISIIVIQCTIIQWDGESKIISLESLVGLYLEIKVPHVGEYGPDHWMTGTVKKFLPSSKWGNQRIMISFFDSIIIYEIDEKLENCLVVCGKVDAESKWYPESVGDRHWIMGGSKTRPPLLAGTYPLP